MTLFSGNDMYSHQVRIVLACKAVNYEVVLVDPNDPPKDLLALNPYHDVPTLVDWDLALYGSSSIIMEYLDERFPHPPLLPVYPIARAKKRLMMFRIQQDWYGLAHKIEKTSGEKKAEVQQQLVDSLTMLSPVFADQPYFLSKDFSLVDCCIAPLLWRLPKLGIELPKGKAKAVLDYAQRVFDSQVFQISLTDMENEIREEDEF